jgi:hypothetical protein
MDIPLLYLLGTTTSSEQGDFVRNALSITPVSGVVVSTLGEGDIYRAAELSRNVLLDTRPLPDLIRNYLDIAQSLGQPLAIITSSDIPLQAVYSDARQEVLK